MSRVTVESDVSWPANTQHTGSHFLDTHVDAEINFIGKLINDKKHLRYFRQIFAVFLLESRFIYFLSVSC